MIRTKQFLVLQTTLRPEILTGLLCLLFFASFAQNRKIDSLKVQIKDAKEDTFLIKNLINLTGEIRRTSPKEALPYALRAREISKRLSWQTGLVKSNYMTAVCQFLLGDDSLALLNISNALVVAKELHRPQQLADIYNLSGVISRTNNDLYKALSFYRLSAKTIEDNHLKLGLDYAYSNIGTVYWDLYDTASANKYYLLALPIALEEKDSFLLAALYNNLYNTSFNITYLKKALDIALVKKDYNNLEYIYNNLGAHYSHELHQYHNAVEHQRQALHYSNIMEDSHHKAKILSSLGDNFRHLGLSDSAEHYLVKSIVVAEESHNMEALRNGHNYLSKLYEKGGKWNAALLHLKKYSNLKDSIFSDKLAEYTTNFDSKFNLTEKEKHIAEQQLQIVRQSNQRNQLIYGGTAAFLLASLLFTWFFQMQKRKKREAELALQLEKTNADNLRHLDQLKSNFFTNLSHELRTPLTLITGPLEQATDRIKDSQAKKEILLAHKNASKLQSLVNEIMDLSKLEANKLNMDFRQVPFDTLLRRIFFSFESLATLRNIHLDFVNTLQDSYLIHTDVKRFEKVINNLVSNAIKFSHNDSTVRMKVVQTDTDVVIAVSDQGKGIHADDLPYVFDRFFQSSHKGMRLEGGTGIGLAYAHEIITRLGGKIKAESVLNEGSTFSIILPITQFSPLSEKVPSKYEQPMSPVEPQSIQGYEPITIGGEKPRILIVEDNKDMQQYLLSLLDTLYRCDFANDGVDALEKMKHTKYDLITSDVMMPRMDGFEFRERICQNMECKNIPFIMLTARAMEEDKLHGLRLGVDDYLTKPFSSAELLARIRNLLANQLERYSYYKDHPEEENKDLSAEQKILYQAESFILEHIDNTQMNVPLLAKEIGYSQRQITRIIKKLTGLTSVNFILEMRLQKARQLLESKSYLSVDEVRYEIGIESASYFSRKFKDRFGKNPSSYF